MVIDPKDFFAAVRPILESGRTVTFAVTGNSMYPFLSHGTEVTIASKATYRRGDVVLAACGESRQIVLHYVADIAGDRYKLMGAANLMMTERCLKSDIIGCMVKPRVSRRAVMMWHALRPLRRHVLWTCRKLRR